MLNLAYMIGFKLKYEFEAKSELFGKLKFELEE